MMSRNSGSSPIPIGNQTTMRSSDRNKKTKNKLKQKGVREDELLPVPVVIDEKQFNKLTGDQKMGNILSVCNMLVKKVAELDVSLNHNMDGVEMRVSLSQAQADDNSAKANFVESLAKEMFAKIKDHSVQLEQLTARSMQNNITISSILGDVKEENCKVSAHNLFTNMMNIPVDMRYLSSSSYWKAQSRFKSHNDCEMCS